MIFISFCKIIQKSRFTPPISLTKNSPPLFLHFSSIHTCIHPFITSNFSHITSNFCLMTSNFCLITSNFCLVTPNFYLVTSNFCLITSNFCLMTSNFYLVTFNFYFMTSNFYLITTNFSLITSNLSPSTPIVYSQTSTIIITSHIPPLISLTYIIVQNQKSPSRGPFFLSHFNPSSIRTFVLIRIS